MLRNPCRRRRRLRRLRTLNLPFALLLDVQSGVGGRGRVVRVSLLLRPKSEIKTPLRSF